MMSDWFCAISCHLVFYFYFLLSNGLPFVLVFSGPN
jgi:hypothetical protein